MKVSLFLTEKDADYRLYISVIMINIDNRSVTKYLSTYALDVLVPRKKLHP